MSLDLIGDGSGGDLTSDDIVRAWIRADILRDPTVRELYEQGIITDVVLDAMVDVIFRRIQDGIMPFYTETVYI